MMEKKFLIPQHRAIFEAESLLLSARRPLRSALDAENKCGKRGARGFKRAGQIGVAQRNWFINLCKRMSVEMGNVPDSSHMFKN